MKKSELRQLIREEIQKLTESTLNEKKFTVADVPGMTTMQLHQLDRRLMSLSAPGFGKGKPAKNGKRMYGDGPGRTPEQDKLLKAVRQALYGKSEVKEASFKSITTQVHDFMDKNKLEHGESTITNDKVEIDGIYKEKHADQIIEFLKTLMPFQMTKFVKKQHQGKWYVWSK